MTRRRRLLVSSACAMALLGVAARPAAAVIPTIDVAALERWAQELQDQVQEYVLQTKQFIEEQTQGIRQAMQYATQLQQYAQEIQLFLNFAHAPVAGLSQLMGQFGLGNSLPVNPQAALGLIQGWRYGAGGFSQLLGMAGQLGSLSNYAYQQNHLYTPDDGSWTSQQLTSRANGIAGEQGAMAAAYADNRTHAGLLTPLRQQLLEAGDTKDVLDASGQMQSEIAWNTNQIGQTLQVSAMADAQRDNLTERDNERLACELEQFRNGGGGCPAGIAAAAAPPQ